MSSNKPGKVQSRDTNTRQHNYQKSGLNKCRHFP